MANEPDRDKRERIDQARVELTEEHLNPLYAEGVGIVREGVERARGAELRRALPPLRLPPGRARRRSAATLLDSTEKVFEQSADRLFRARVGIGLDEAQRWDVIRTFRAPEWDPQFPAEKMLPALEATLTDMGVDLKSQKNVELDVEQRPKKSPRAFCAPIEVPGRVVLVIQPMGGADDWRALFHEAGPHRALREHLGRPLDGGEAPRRRRGHRGLGDADAAPDGRPGLAHAAPRLPAARRTSRSRA